MDELIELKLKSGNPITTSETKQFLDFMAYCVRRDTGIVDIKDVDCAKCNETSRLVGSLAFSYNCDCDRFSFKEIMDVELTHYINIVSINTIEGQKSFLVDLTYIQFFKEQYRLDNMKTINMKQCVITNNQINLSKKLIEQGYIEFTKENFEIYIDTFLEAYGKVMPIDKQMIYSKINNYFENNDLVFDDITNENETVKQM